MPLFATICSCSLLFACSKQGFQMLFSGMLVFSPSLWCWYLLYFCHASLNLLLCYLAVAQCSCFVKHLEYITAICFVSMLECSSLVSCCILDGVVLLITGLCHSCFACHLLFQGLRILLSPCSAVILMPCKHDATEWSMLVLSIFSKGVLDIWLWSIHPWSALACLNLALLLL